MKNTRSTGHMCLAGLILAAWGCRPIVPSQEQPIGPMLQELQRSTASPQPRLDNRAQDPNQPLGILEYPGVQPGPNTVRLTLEQAVARALANSPEIRVVSIDAAIAQQDITARAAELDPMLFGKTNLEENDLAQASAYDIGQASTRVLETGVKQRIPTGAEYSLTYSFTRTWDDLWYHGGATRYVPVLAFELRQPLLRDRGRDITLAGVDVALLNHQIALLAFRQKAQELAAAVITAYWQLAEARREQEIFEQLLQMATETLEKVQARVGIDATEIQIQQARFNLRTSQAQLVQATRQVSDAQDRLVRLLADPQLGILSGCQVVTESLPEPNGLVLELDMALRMAIKNNPVLQQARLAVRIQDINCKVAANQAKFRLDLVASTSTQALRDSWAQAQEDLVQAGQASYAIGVVLEYPIGNRQKEAELAKSRLERKRALANLQNLADQVAVQARERHRKVLAALQQVQAHAQATDAARIQLQAIADSEPVRDRLTPEFLLVKLQAQEALTESQIAKARAVTEYHIALAELAQITGTVLGMYELE